MAWFGEGLLQFRFTNAGGGALAETQRHLAGVSEAEVLEKGRGGWLREARS